MDWYFYLLVKSYILCANQIYKGKGKNFLSLNTATETTTATATQRSILPTEHQNTVSGLNKGQDSRHLRELDSNIESKS